MAAVTGAAVMGATALYGAKKQSDAGKDAARAQEEASRLGIAEQQRQYGETQQNLQPYMQTGTGALSRLEALSKGDYSGFENAPDYLYAKDQMQAGIERGAAARGALYNQGTNVDLARHLGGLASQNLGNYKSGLMGLASLGQNSAAGLGSLGQQSANAITGLHQQAGQAKAQSAYDSANAWSNAASQIGSLAGQYAGNRSSSYTPTTGGSGWGAFAPNQPGFSNATAQPYMGGSAFGSWGQGWGG